MGVRYPTLRLPRALPRILEPRVGTLLCLAPSVASAFCRCLLWGGGPGALLEEEVLVCLGLSAHWAREPPLFPEMFREGQELSSVVRTLGHR